MVKRTLFIFILCIINILIYIVINQSDKYTINKVNSKPSITITELQSITYDEKGDGIYELSAVSAISDLIDHLEAFNLSMNQINNKSLKLLSPHAIFNDNMVVFNKLNLVDDHSLKEFELQLTELDLSNFNILSKQPVLVKYNHSITTADGLFGNLKSQEINLSGNVKFIYQTNAK